MDIPWENPVRTMLKLTEIMSLDLDLLKVVMSMLGRGTLKGTDAGQTEIRDPWVPPEDFFGRFGPKVGNGAENLFPGPSGPEAQNVKIGVEKSQKWKFQLLFNLFWLFVNSVLSFFEPAAAGPRTSFSTPFPTLDAQGPRTVCSGAQTEIRENSHSSF